MNRYDELIDMLLTFLKKEDKFVSPRNIKQNIVVEIILFIRK